jgi:hypothetical protein
MVLFEGKYVLIGEFRAQNGKLPGDAFGFSSQSQVILEKSIKMGRLTASAAGF